MSQRDYDPNPFAGVLYVIGWLVVAIAAGIALVIYANGCAHVEPSPTEPDAGPSDCDRAAQQLEQLGCVVESVCSEADCDDFGARCEALERDFPGYLNLPCLVVASDCDAVTACAQ